MRATTLRKLAPGLPAALAVLLGAAVCRADDAQELEPGKSRFDAGQYREAHEQLAVLLDPARPPCDKGPSGGCRLSDPDLVERARVLDVASLIALKRTADADVLIEKVLRSNPAYAPSPLLFPQEVVERFSEIHARIRPELDRITDQRAKEAMAKRLADQKAHDVDEQWIADLQKQASQRVEVSSRWVAMLPGGVGQYQNGDIRLGVVFTVSEVLLAATTVASGAIVANYFAFDRTRPCDAQCYATLNNNIAAGALVNRIAFGTLGAVILGGIIQAQVAFVPERASATPRAIPPRPRLTPTATAGPGSFGVGLVGSF